MTKHNLATLILAATLTLTGINTASAEGVIHDTGRAIDATGDLATSAVAGTAEVVVNVVKVPLQAVGKVGEVAGKSAEAILYVPYKVTEPVVSKIP